MTSVPTVTISNDAPLVRVNGVPIGLTVQELHFIMFLVEQKGKVCTPEMLLREFYANGVLAGTKIFDVLACKIRKKLDGVAPKASSPLRTVWGRGYAWGKPERKSKPVRGLPNPKRWVISHKAAILTALMTGKVTEGEILSHYPDMSETELKEWYSAFSTYGQLGLRTTSAGMYLYRNLKSAVL